LIQIGGSLISLQSDDFGAFAETLPSLASNGWGLSFDQNSNERKIMGFFRHLG
jgi:hypothetical protein